MLLSTAMASTTALFPLLIRGPWEPVLSKRYFSPSIAPAAEEDEEEEEEEAAAAEEDENLFILLF